MLTTQNGVFHISGELTFKTVPTLWKKSLPELAKLPELHFDLTKVTASNSAGVALMLEWVKYGERMKKSVSFRNVPAQLNSIIAVSGIKKLLDTA